MSVALTTTYENCYFRRSIPPLNETLHSLNSRVSVCYGTSAHRSTAEGVLKVLICYP
jgi:hypothetical protein